MNMGDRTDTPGATFIVVMQQIVGNENGFYTTYSWDMERFERRGYAISHGFKTRGSDDFNIGTLLDDRLIAFGWMDEDAPEEKYDRLEIERQIDLLP
jgi:hypothetical protein